MEHKLRTVGLIVLVSVLAVVANGFVFWLGWEYIVAPKLGMNSLSLWDCALLTLIVRVTMFVPGGFKRTEARDARSTRV
jgi:hypothetical protein